MEDLRDQRMQRYLSENLAAKWFCELGLDQPTPDHSYFGDFRKRIVSQGPMDIFAQVRESLKAMGLVREVFTFVGVSMLISKLTTWDERDKAVKAGLERFNNETASQVALDPQAHFELGTAVP